MNGIELGLGLVLDFARRPSLNAADFFLHEILSEVFKL